MLYTLPNQIIPRAFDKKLPRAYAVRFRPSHPTPAAMPAVGAQWFDAALDLSSAGAIPAAGLNQALAGQLGYPLEVEQSDKHGSPTRTVRVHDRGMHRIDGAGGFRVRALHLVGYTSGDADPHANIGGYLFDIDIAESPEDLDGTKLDALSAQRAGSVYQYGALVPYTVNAVSGVLTKIGRLRGERRTSTIINTSATQTLGLVVGKLYAPPVGVPDLSNCIPLAPGASYVHADPSPIYARAKDADGYALVVDQMED